MKKSNETRYVIVEGKKVDVSAEIEKVYRNMQDTYRVKQFRRGECHCPKSKRLCCSGDCSTCPYKNTTNVYLDGLHNDEGENYSGEYLFQNARDGYSAFEDSFVDNEERKAIIQWLQEFAPEIIEYGKLKMEGYTNAEIAEILGIKRSTMDSRRAKAFADIQNIFPNAKF